MKKVPSDLSQVTTVSHDVESPDVLPLGVPGLDVAAFQGGWTTCDDDDPEIFPPESLDRTTCEQENKLKDYNAKHPHGPSKGTDSGLELSYYPNISSDSTTVMEAPNTMSIAETVDTSRQPGVEYVMGTTLATTLSSHDIAGDVHLHRDQQRDSMHHLVATLVEPAPIAEVISDSEKSRSRKLLWTGGLILVVFIVVIVTVNVTRRNPDYSNQILEALNPVLPDSSKESINKAGTPQFQAFQWLKAHEGVDSLLDVQIRQHYALATIYYATDGFEWSYHSGWLSNVNECNWYFSNSTNVCTNGVLTILALDSNNLNGMMPPDISMLSSLTHLDLSGNLLTRLNSSSLAQLTSLAHLDLGDNHLTQLEASSLAHLTNLAHLDLGDNPLIQLDTSSLARLTNLAYLDLNGLDLPGLNTSSLAHLTNLAHLDLGDNKLTQLDISSLTQLTNLAHLNLSGNSLTALEASSVAQLRNLAYLDLRGNSLNRLEASPIVQLTNLVYLDLGANGLTLTGSAPSSLAQLTNLEYLSLASNKLIGTITSLLGQVTSLESLDLGENSLMGSIPSSIGQLTHLKHLDLHENILFGSIPSFIGQLTNLNTLYLFGNLLTGTIPSEVCAFVNLTEILLDCNKISCGCSSGICVCG